MLAPSTLPADIEAQYQAYQTQIAALTPEIERLTNHADGIDYAAAVSCGIVTGMLDALLPGAKWDFREAKAWSNKSVNMMIQEFAEKDPEYKQFCEYTQAGRLRETAKDPNRLSNAVEFLEKKYKLPGDSGWNLKNNLVTLAKEHGYTGKSAQIRRCASIHEYELPASGRMGRAGCADFCIIAPFGGFLPPPDVRGSGKLYLCTVYRHGYLSFCRAAVGGAGAGHSE